MYDLCLTCCQELRSGKLPGGENADSNRLHLKSKDEEDEDQDDSLSPGPSQQVNGESEVEKSNKQSKATPPETSVKEDNTGTPLSQNSTKTMDLEPKAEVKEEEEKISDPVDSAQKDASEAANGEKRAPDTETVEVPAESLLLPPWKALENGEIPCPPELRGGCGNHMLGLRTLFETHWLEETIRQAEEELQDDMEDETELEDQTCPCSDLSDKSSPKVRLAAHRPDGKDNYIYCPTYSEVENEGSSHFQKHWRQGHPVIVRNVDEGSTGLSWEPMVMWRAVREITGSRRTFKEDTQSAFAVDCADWNEVSLTREVLFRLRS